VTDRTFAICVVLLAGGSTVPEANASPPIPPPEVPMTPPTDDSPLVERVKGAAKGLAGAVTGDEDLAREGRLHTEKAEALDDANRLEAQAAQDAEDAELAQREHDLEAERRRLADEETADRRQQRIEEERQKREARIEAQAAGREQAVEAETRAAGRAAAHQRVEAARDRAEEHQEADTLEGEAERARRQAEVLDAAADTVQER